MSAVLRVIAVVAGLVFFLGGAGFAGLPITNELQKNQQVSSAQSVEATVLSTNMAQRFDGPDDSPSESYWSIQVRYRYTVDGTTYESGYVTPPGEADAGTNIRRPNRTAAASFLDQYQENTTVTAYYTPPDPAGAFLIQETTPLVALAIPAVFGFLVGGVGLVLLGFGTGILTLPRR